MNLNKEVERVWIDFWMEIVYKNGVLDVDQIKRELYDFHEMIDEVSKVYDKITGGMISKPNTCADAVISVYEDRLQDLIEEEIENQIKEEKLIKNDFSDKKDREGKMGKLIVTLIFGLVGVGLLIAGGVHLMNNDIPNAALYFSMSSLSIIQFYETGREKKQ